MPPMDLDELDRQINGAPDTGGLVVTHAEWHALDRAVGADPRVTRDGEGRLSYRSMPIMISGESRLASRGEAEEWASWAFGHPGA